MTSCAISGHRPTRFKFGYKETHTGCKRLKRVMREQFDLLYQQGVREFYVGGALGVDMWAAEILLRMKEQSAYSDLLLHMVLPFAGHDANWDERSRERLRFIMRHCADTVVIGIPGQLPLACYKLRNQYLVDHADCLLAVYDSDRSIRSGTGQTVHYAQRRGLHPITKSRTLLEEVFCFVIEKKGEKPTESGDIGKLYNQVKLLYHMHQSAELDKRINGLLSGLEKILSAIAEMRNKGSDAHGVGGKRININDYHARLFVNSAMTMADFILAVSEHAT